MNSSYDVIVIGLGATGSATCAELAARGQRTLGLEQFGIPHDQGSYHGNSRVIRICYYEHPDYVPLLRRAYECWATLEQDSGETLMHLTGGLYMGHEDGEFVTGSLRSAREHDLPHEALSHADIRRRFPQFQLSESHVGVFEPRAGYLLPEAAVSAYARRALIHGADIRVNQRVQSWESDGSRVRVHTSTESFDAERLVICAGAWSGKILGAIGVPIVASRQVLGWIWPKKPEMFAQGVLPIWGIDDPDGYFYYGFPLQAGRVGLKMARHYVGPTTDADTIDRTPQPAEAEEFRAAIRRYLPDADGPMLDLSICMYANTPDAHFVVDRHPAHENVVFGAGYSGHGFKFAGVMGEVLSDLSIKGRTDWPIEFLRVSRFQGGA